MNDMGYEFRTTISKEYLVIPKLDDNNYTLTITLDSGRYYLDDFFREMMAIYTINIKTKNNE